MYMYIHLVVQELLLIYKLCILIVLFHFYFMEYIPLNLGNNPPIIFLPSYTVPMYYAIRQSIYFLPMMPGYIQDVFIHIYLQSVVCCV